MLVKDFPLHYGRVEDNKAGSLRLLENVAGCNFRLFGAHAEGFPVMVLAELNVSDDDDVGSVVDDAQTWAVPAVGDGGR